MEQPKSPILRLSHIKSEGTGDFSYKKNARLCIRKSQAGYVFFRCLYALLLLLSTSKVPKLQSLNLTY